MKNVVINKFLPHIKKDDGYVVYKPPVVEKRIEILQPPVVSKPKEIIKASLKAPMLAFMLKKEVKQQKIVLKEPKKPRRSKPKERLVDKLL